MLALACAAVGTTSAQVFECPASIPEKSIHLTDVAPEWKVYVGAPLYLHSAAPTNGPPEQLGELADFTERSAKREWSRTYELDGQFPNGKWLACMYGEGDQVSLGMRLPESVKSCTFVYRKGQYVGQHDIQIRCKP
ncbi:STY0301 family protein [Pseudoduganella sp. RAF53_2]|uniref:STY0301 family protein n=1 Tax=unclassified Pseudoduganella TaxID=2637179 RepID=UPI003F95CA15